MAIKVQGSTIIDDSRNVINATKVGIGTINPTVALDVRGTVGIGTIIDIIPYDTINNGTLSWEGSAGQLFSITNNLTSGSIFSVNDVSGIPSIDVDADGTIQLAPFGSTEYVGIGTTNPQAKLHVNGNLIVSGIITANSLSVSSTTLVNNLNADLLDGQEGSYYTNASNINAGTIGDAYLPATITSDITGNAATATTATQVSNTLTRGTYLTGNNYNGSAATTWAVDATSANTASKVVARDGSGNFSANTVTLAGELRGPASFIIDPATVGDNTGTVVIKGNLQIDGTTTTVNSTTITVDDKNIELGSVASPSDTTADTGGITLKGTTDKTFNWINSTDSWTSSEHIDIASGKVYKINTTEVLSATTLGSGVVNSSLTSLGTIATGVWQGTAINDDYIGTIDNANKVSLSALDIDGGTATTTLSAADLLIVDDGANGTNRKITAANAKTYFAAGASSVNLADESTDTTCFPVFATTATGDQALKTGSNLTFDSATGVLGATTFSGSGASLTSLNASNISTGTLAIARGGTNGSATPTAGAIAYGNAGTSYGFSAAGTSGQVLLSGGTGSPTWANQSTLSVGSATTTTNIPNLTGDVTSNGTVTSIAPGVIVNADINASAAIDTSKLSANTISGITLGGNLNTLTRGTYLTGNNYNGSTATTWAVDATSANTASKVVARDASGNFSAGTITASLTGSASLNVLKAGDTMTGQLINTRANNAATGSGQIYLNGATGNRIDWNGNGVAAPTFTTRSAGTKLVLYPIISASQVDYALGIEGSTLWYSVPTTSQVHRWYGGTTSMMSLTNSNLDVVGTVTGSRLISDVATGTAPLTVTSTTVVTNLNVDQVDGLEASQFLRSDANDSASGVIDFLGGASSTPAVRIKSGGSSWSEGLAIHPSADNSFALAFFRTSATLTTNTNTWAIGNLGTNSTNNFGLLRNGLTGGSGIRVDSVFDVTQAGVFRFGFNPTVGSDSIWHAGNDGSGSGLDADLLDGQEGSYYRNATNINAGTLAIARGGTNGAASPTAGAISYGTGTAYAFSAAGSSNQVLLSGGTGSPTWANQSTLSVGSATTTTNIPNLTGDVTSNGTVTSIAPGVIVNADINASAAIVDTKLATISTANKVSISALNIDGGTATTTLVDADLFIVDDGANGTNRKITAANAKTYFTAGAATPTWESGGVGIITTSSVGINTTTVTGVATSEGSLQVTGNVAIVDGILLTDQNIDTNLTVPSGKNGLLIGPATVGVGVTVDISSGSTLVIV